MGSAAILPAPGVVPGAAGENAPGVVMCVAGRPVKGSREAANPPVPGTVGPNADGAGPAAGTP